MELPPTGLSDAEGLVKPAGQLGRDRGQAHESRGSATRVRAPWGTRAGFCRHDYSGCVARTARGRFIGPPTAGGSGPGPGFVLLPFARVKTAPRSGTRRADQPGGGQVSENRR